MKNILFLDSIMHGKGEGLRAANVTLISGLRENGAETENSVFRLENQDISIDEFNEKEKAFILDSARKAGGCDFVCISGWTGSWDRMKRLAKAIKEKNPKVKIIFGGAHIDLVYLIRQTKRNSPLDVVFNECPEIDYCVFGEGEKTLLEIVKGISPEKIKGLAYREGKEIRYNQERELEPDLDRLPFPDVKKDELGGHTDWVYIEASRGCKYRCRFCIEPLKWGYKYRIKSPERIIKEIEYWYDKGIRNFRFTDSSLMSYPRLTDLLSGIIDQKLGVKWSGFARISEIGKNPDLIKTMKAAGCETLLIGFESGEQHILEKMNKCTSLDEARSVVTLLRKNGIKIRGSWVLGFPGETRDMAKKTVKFAKELKLDAYAPHIYENQESVFTKYEFGQFGTRLDVPTRVFIELFQKEKVATESSQEMHEIARVAGQVIDENLLSKETDLESGLSELAKFRRMHEFLGEVAMEMKGEGYDKRDKFDRTEFTKPR